MRVYVRYLVSDLVSVFYSFINVSVYLQLPNQLLAPLTKVEFLPGGPN